MRVDVRPPVKRLLRGACLPLLALAGWQILSRARGYAYGFPAPLDVARSLGEALRSGELASSLWSSLQRMAIGIALGAAGGLALGGVLAMSKTADRLLGPSIHGLRQIPHLGLAPLMTLWFGTGDPAKLILVVIAAFYPVMLGTYHGVHDIDAKFFEVARVLRLSRAHVVSRVLVPAAAPHVIAGIAQAVPFAWMATLGGELLLRSGTGVGTLMQAAAVEGRSDLAFACTLAVVVVSLLVDQLLTRAQRRATPWSGSLHRSPIK